MNIANRADLEKRLARVVGKALGEQRKQIVDLLGDPPNLDNLTPATWEALDASLRAALAPELQAIYLEQARAMLEEDALGVDWALVNQAAADWASRYSFELVKGIGDNSRAALQSAVSAYFEQGQTIGQLEGQLVDLFGPVRAESISVTEVTRAASMGESEIVSELAGTGIEMDEFWETNNDELVCPICGAAHHKEKDEPIDREPFNGKSWGEVYPDGPPAHPRCRCNKNHALRGGKKK